MPVCFVDLDHRGVDLVGVGEGQVAGFGLGVRRVEGRPVDVAAVEADPVGELVGEDGDVRVAEVGDADHRDRPLLVALVGGDAVRQHDVRLLALQGEGREGEDLAAQLFGGADRGADPGHRELRGVGAGEADVGRLFLVEAGVDADHAGVAAEDVGDDLGGGRLVALALRRRPEVDGELAVDVEFGDRRLAVAGEGQVGVDDLRLAEVVGAGVEGRADPDPDPLAVVGGVDLGLLLAPLRVAELLERQVELLWQIARVVDAFVRRLVRIVLRLDVVLLAQLDRVEVELAWRRCRPGARSSTCAAAASSRGWGRSGTCWSASRCSRRGCA